MDGGMNRYIARQHADGFYGERNWVVGAYRDRDEFIVSETLACWLALAGFVVGLAVGIWVIP